MDRVVLDDTVTTQLRGLRELCFLFDAAGNRLGYFLPQIDKSCYEGLEPPFDREELRRANDEAGGRPLWGILADLERGQ